MESNPSREKLAVSDRHQSWYTAGWLGAMIAVVAGSSAVVMARTHSVSIERKRLNAVADAGPHVLVTHPQAAAAERRLTLPATIQGYVETPVFAKIAGYLKEIRVDKGDRVHKGQVLATLESPELDEQVADARHYLWLQSVTNTRNQGLVLTHAISQQIADNSQGAMMQARDSYRQLLALKAYEVITAPFDGIVTARYVDPGVLVAQTITPTRFYLLSHTAETASPLVTLATLNSLRVYASAPQNVANFIDDGTPAVISVVQRPARMSGLRSPGTHRRWQA
jgi:membrane fusion protein, multidrug efflux system